MKTSQVYELPFVGSVPAATLAASMDNILNFHAYRLLRIFAHEEVVGVKPCLNGAEHSLDYVSPVVQMLRGRGVTPVLCDTTDRYRDLKRNAVRRMEELAAQVAGPSIPIVILDGIKGEHEYVRRGGKDAADVHLAGELPSLGGVVLVSCVQEDTLAGLSGILVNLGVGLSSTRGKIKHYAMHPPRVHQAKCYACRRCLRECPAGAISMSATHAVIDPQRCINCGRCIEVARFGGISYEWDATPEHFRTVVTAHAGAAVRVLNHRVVCLSVVNLPPDKTGQARMNVLFSRDPVAIDAAAVDMLAEHGLLTDAARALAAPLLAQAETAGLGHREYRLERIAF